MYDFMVIPAGPENLTLFLTVFASCVVFGIVMGLSPDLLGPWAEKIYDFLPPLYFCFWLVFGVYFGTVAALLAVGVPFLGITAK